MVDAYAVEKSMYVTYKNRFGRTMDEMKMHKLMYFLQRESLLMNNSPLFSEAFYGWVYGPVLKSVREEYKGCKPYNSPANSLKTYSSPADSLKKEEQYLVENVLSRYGNLSSWKLSSLSHNEYSWKKSRQGLALDERGDRTLKLEAMKVDAARERAERNTK